MPQIAFLMSINVESTPYFCLLASISVVDGRQEGAGGGRLGNIFLGVRWLRGGGGCSGLT